MGIERHHREIEGSDLTSYSIHHRILQKHSQCLQKESGEEFVLWSTQSSKDLRWMLQELQCVEDERSKGESDY